MPLLPGKLSRPAESLACQFLSYWAKTTSTDEPGITVCQHGQAAGEVARVLTAQLPQRFQDALQTPSGVILAALHDIGKISPGFQRKCPAWLKKYGLDPSSFAGCEPDHAKVSQAILQNMLCPNDDSLRFWAAIVGAHHGKVKGDRLSSLSNMGCGEPWDGEHSRFCQEMTALFGPLPGVPPRGDPPWDSSSLWFNAGLIAVADWLASDETMFPADLPLNSEEIEQRAACQVRNIGFTQPPCAVGKSFHDLFGFDARPLQRSLWESAAQPGIYVVEGAMGCGKTEAALSLAYRLISGKKALGLYFGLPTQATSNCIHKRIRDFLAKIDPDAQTRLIHGNSWLMSDTLNMRVGGENEQVATDWFASPRRALLAPWGVGTLDQALLGIVAAKHFFVRQFALAGKVVVLDEVHTYDIYTGTLVDILVRRLRSLGATVIILSATLTAERRRQLLGLQASEESSTDAYPLISANLEDGGRLYIPIAPDAPKKVSVRFKKAPTLLESCLERAHAGECVLWLRNTVDRAQETFRELKGQVESDGPVIGLLHSRFPQFRREELESRWIGALGKDGSTRPSKGCVLVSTQVAEQSIDIDADLLITDPAPTDMLLQRVGRLWRHQRSRPGGAECQVWIDEPPLNSVELRTASREELKEALGKNAKVYAPYILLRTLALWLERDHLLLPGDIRPLIEATYSPLLDEPAAWRGFREHLEAQKEKMAAQALANSNPWSMPALPDEEGVQTRWSGLPTAMLLPFAKIDSWNGSRWMRGLLLDGTPCEIRRSKWDFQLAKAIHRNLVKIPLWTVLKQAKETPSFLTDYVNGSVVACALDTDGSLRSASSDTESCLSYSHDQGVRIHPQSKAGSTAWKSHKEEDDEFDE